MGFIAEMLVHNGTREKIADGLNRSFLDYKDYGYANGFMVKLSHELSQFISFSNHL